MAGTIIRQYPLIQPGLVFCSYELSFLKPKFKCRNLLHAYPPLLPRRPPARSSHCWWVTSSEAAMRGLISLAAPASLLLF
jgi:hypothetical protein